MVYIALPVSSQPRIVKMLNELRDTTASIYFVPDFFVSDLIQARIDHIAASLCWRYVKPRSMASTGLENDFLMLFFQA